MYKPFAQTSYTPSNKPKAIYLRKSKKKNGMTEKETIESHKNQVISFCREQGWNDYVIYNDYVAKSTNLNRTEYRLMLEACLEGKHDMIVVVEESRLYRTIYEQSNVYEELKGTDIVILSIREGYIFPNDRNQFLSNYIRGLMNQQELENFAYRMNVKKLATAKEGIYVNKAPFGYIKEKNGLIPHPEEYKAFRLIVEDVLNGHVIAEIIPKLNRLGYTTKNGQKFKEVGTITRMLKNRVYLGESHYYSKMFDETVIKRDTHQPLLTIEEYQKVNSIIRSRSRNPHAIRYTKINTPLDRLIVCGLCGSRLPIHKSWTNLQGITSYQIGKCQNKIGDDYGCKCPNKSISLKELLPIFYSMLPHYKSLLKEEIEKSKINTSNEKKINIMNQIKDTKKRIDEINEELKNAKMYLIKKTFTESEYLELKSELETTLKELEISLEDNERLLNSITDYDRTSIIEDALKYLEDIENKDVENQNRIFRMLFEHIELINTTEEFEINLKEKDMAEI